MARRRNMKTSTMWQLGLATAALSMLYVHRRRRIGVCFKQRFAVEYAQAMGRTGGAVPQATTMAVQRAKAACGKPFGIF